MDDLASKLNELLNSPEQMQMLMNMASTLGLGASPAQGMQPPAAAPAAGNAGFGGYAAAQQPAPAAQPAPGNLPDVSGLAAMLNSLLAGAMGSGAPAGGTPPAAAPAPIPSANPGLPGLDMNLLFGLQRAMASMNQEDQNVTLLRALRPIFSPERQKKVDDAIKIMQLIKLLPLIKETGLFGGRDR